MRIQVFFNATPILVPCGDGHLTVGELIQKAILRFKKVVDKHPDDVIEVRSLRLADTGSFVDQDDEVAEVLEDREAVILDYEYIPHYVAEGGGGASMSDDSALTPSSQPFSPMTLADETSGPAHYERQNHTHSDGYMTAESGIHDPQYPPLEGERGGREDSDEVSGLDIPAEIRDTDEREPEEGETVMKGVGEGEGEEGEGEHLPNPQASQDTELVVTGAGWEEGERSSQEPESPHLTSRKATWSQVDSGYAPKSQESFSHSQPKSLEAYSTSQDLSLQEGGTLSGGALSGGAAGEFSRDFSALTHAQAEGTKRGPPEKKEEANLRGSQRGGGYEYHSPRGNKRTESGSHSRTQRSSNEGNYMMSPSRSRRPGDFGGYQLGFDRHPRGVDMSGRGGRDHYGGYPGGVRDYRDIYGSSYGDHEGYLRGHGLPGEPYPHPDWRRSYAGGEFDHSPYGGRGIYGDIHMDPLHMRGRYDRGGLDTHRGGLDAHRGGRFSTRRDRLMEEARMLRTKSHERVDHMGGPRGGYRPDDEVREPPVDYYLSQPTTPHFPYDRPPGFTMPPPPANHLHPGVFDHRQAMGGPSGYSLSQPISYLPPRGAMHGPPQDFDRGRLFPLMERGGSQRLRGEDRGRDRAYSLDEDYEDDEDLDTKDRRVSQTLNPFKRDFRKSIFRDGAVFSNWMERVHEYGIEDEDAENMVPLFEGDISQSQRSLSPQPPPPPDDTTRNKERGDEESGEEEEEFGNVHIIELHKADEPLGIHLTHFTAPDGTDLGVFIGGMEENGFAAKSEKLKINDRILACNGVDFTKEPYKNQVEELFLEMVAKEPLLRMAVSRGVSLSLDDLEGDTDGEHREDAGPAPSSGGEGSSRSETTADRRPDTTTLAPSNTVTNTRQIGVKHTIQITKGSRGYGFGIASRDVTTDNQNTPIYVKNIIHDGAAFHDGRLRIGDRILEVDGRGVEGLSQSEVVQLLRQSEGSVTMVISRQEIIEKREEEEFSPSPSSSASATPGPSIEPTTVGKTVLNLEIPLYDSGPAGLGVTVFGRSTITSSRHHGDMGVFIKSIVPGGAAALDGRLCRGDQLLCISTQSLLGKSNSEALDTLRKTLTTATGSGSKIKLVVARKTGVNKKQPGMTALEESPVEDDVDRGVEPGSTEVGIDIGAEALARQSRQTRQTRQTGGASQTSQTGTSQTSQTGASQTSQTSQTGASQASQTSQTGASQTSIGAVEMEASQSSIDMEPRRGILRHSTDSPGHSPKSSSGHTHSHKSHTLPHSSPAGTKRPSPSLTRRTQTTANSSSSASQPSSPGLRKTYLPVKKTSPNSGRKLVSATGSVLGSGEFDRLEPRLDAETHGSQGYGGNHFVPVAWSPMDGGDWGRGMVRTPSLNSDLSSALGSQYPRYLGYNMYPSLPHLSPAFLPSFSHYSPNYPPTTDAMATGHTHPIPPRLHNGSYESQFSDSGYGLRGNEASYPHGYDSSSLRRQESHSNELLSLSYPGNDVMSNVSFSAVTLSREQAPTRGSGRKERQKSDSSLLRGMDGGSSSDHSDMMYNSRSTSHTRSATPPPVLPGQAGEEEEEEDEGLLDDLRLSDTELSSFRRDDKGRISITKKTKKNPRQDFAHLTLSNPVPILEGEGGLYRTGSDSCLPEAVERTTVRPPLLVVERGPSLGMAKSSSLESLHNMVAHSIKRDAVKRASGRGRGVGPGIISQPTHSRVIQIPTFLGDRQTRDNAAVIIYPKNSAANKKPQKRSLFKKVFKKKKGSKYKSSGKDKSEVSAAVPDADTRSLDGELDEGEMGEGEGGTRRPRNSLDGYDSNDEVLATIAKV